MRMVQVSEEKDTDQCFKVLKKNIEKTFKKTLKEGQVQNMGGPEFTLSVSMDASVFLGLVLRKWKISG